MGVGENTILQNLQQNVEHIWVCLFDFIEQHDRVRMAADFFCQLPAFIIAHISGRGADHFGGAVLFHIFRHVDTDHGIFIAEHYICQRLGQFCFSHTGGT